ncbi:hypothetical protein BOO71_0000946 [Deinococcus marmoris]|uniref:Uncharacterized protein n=2 Tax=Deinococcus marmoris TaxID=249408 RepID=A0A1U7P4E0_9DEIO|nr:hypothetical protein BOO71_0000946 [Deinococcus marmoris]
MVHECLENEINDLNELDVFAATKPFIHFPELIEQHRSKLEDEKIMDDLRDQWEFTYDEFI